MSSGAIEQLGSGHLGGDWLAERAMAGPPGAAAETFRQALHQAAASASRGPLREAASQFVASAFIVPVLSSLRHSALAADGPFAAGAAERRFGPLLDLHVADRIVQAGRWPIVDAIVSRFEDPGAAPRLSKGSWHG